MPGAGSAGAARVPPLWPFRSCGPSPEQQEVESSAPECTNPREGGVRVIAALHTSIQIHILVRTGIRGTWRSVDSGKEGVILLWCE